MQELIPQATNNTSSFPKTSGSAIKKNIQGVLSKKYGELDTRNLFDGIDDKDVENNIETAESAIKTNLDSGTLNKSTLPKLPHLRDGLALSYAAANKGKSKAATKAREAAYMKFDEPLVKDTGIKLLSTEFPTMQNAKKETLDMPSVTKFSTNKDKAPKIENYVWKPNSESKTKTFLDNSNKSNFFDDFEKARNGIIPKNYTDIKFKAWTNNNTKNKNTYDSLKNALTKTDLDSGIKVSKSSDHNYYYDYTDVIMNRIREVLPEFSNHKIMSYPEYYQKYSNLIYEPSFQDYYKFHLNDYIYFYNQVNHGAPWDIKRDDPWKQQFGDIKMPYYDSNPPKDEKFLFKNELVTREDLGNILYGYLGSAMGISDIILYQGAGIAASRTNIFDGDLFDADAYYGDNYHDHEYIKKGIKMFYEDYPKEKA